MGLFPSLKDQMSNQHLDKCYYKHFADFAGHVKELVTASGDEMDVKSVLEVISHIEQPMVDVILHVDRRSWHRLVHLFSSFSLQSACKQISLQLDHIKQDPIVKGKHPSQVYRRKM